MQFKPHASNEIVTIEKKLSDFQQGQSYAFAEATISLDSIWKGQAGIPNLQSLRLILKKPGKMTLAAATVCAIVPDRGLKLFYPNQLVTQNAGCN